MTYIGVLLGIIIVGLAYIVVRVVYTQAKRDAKPDPNSSKGKPQ